MMKHIKNTSIKIIFMVTAIVSINSCSDDYLQDTKRDGLNSEIVFASDATAEAAINGVYDALQGSPSEFIVKGIYYPANYLTQDWLNIGADTFFQSFEIPVTFEPFNAQWKQSYAGIGRANTALEALGPAIQNGKVSDSLGSRLIGECYGVRGVLYSLIASNFGGVPLVLQPAGGDVDAFAPRNTQAEVFQQVVLDMQEAVERLPWEYDTNNIGRLTKGAAYAYMGSAYMWLGEYEKAIDAYEKLEGHYTLEEEFLDIHAYANPFGKESIFELGMSNAGGAFGFNDHQDDVTFWQSFCMPWEISNGGSYSAGTKEFYDSFEAGDDRKLATILGPGDENPDPVININEYVNVFFNYDGINTVGTVENPWKGNDGLEGERTGYYMEKSWRNPNVKGWGSAQLFGDNNIILLRYGQIMISLAECYHKSGNDAMAMQYINRIRNRANLTNQPTGDMMTIILDEYRHELSGEFSLWFLYRRSGNASSYLNEKFGVTVPQGHELMPIPQQQIDANPNLIQNSGY